MTTDTQAEAEADATEYRWSTADVAQKLGCHRKTVGDRARAAGVGIYLSGRAGMRFSDRDIELLVASLRPTPAEVKPRRRRRRRGVSA